MVVVLCAQLNGSKSQSTAHNTRVSDELVLYEPDLTTCVCAVERG